MDPVHPSSFNAFLSKNLLPPPHYRYYRCLLTLPPTHPPPTFALSLMIPTLATASCSMSVCEMIC